jgi:serine/threonine-protein phosphatase 2B regulatory subunit
MGGRTSVLSSEDLEELEILSGFTSLQLKRLYKRFKRLDKDNKGGISREEFLSIPELAMNPLSPRILSLFDTRHEDVVDFRNFIEILSIFRGTNTVSREQKMKFVFRLYDVNEDGYITADDLTEVLRLMVGQHLTDEQIREIVETTIHQADTIDYDGKLSFEEFSRVIYNTNIENKLTVIF